MDRTNLLFIAFRIIIIGIIAAAGMHLSCNVQTKTPKSNYEAVVADLQKIALTAQDWYKQSHSLGGGVKLNEFTLDKVKLSGSNNNGTYSILDKGNAISFVIQGYGKEDTDGDGKPVTINMRIFADSTLMEVISK